MENSMQINNSGADLDAILPAGRYFLGDPGLALKGGLSCLMNDIVEDMGGIEGGSFSHEGLPIVAFKPQAGRARYPDTSPFMRGMYENTTAYLGLVDADLCVSARYGYLWYNSAFIDVNETFHASLRDGMFTVTGISGAVYVRIDGVLNRMAPRSAQVIEPSALPMAA